MSADPESKRAARLPWFKMLFDQGIVNTDIIEHLYDGSGTESDPYVVTFFKDDPRDPMTFPGWIRWIMCIVVSLITLSVSFLSSAYSAGIPQIEKELGGSSQVNILGVSLFVLGFAFGPFLWAPFSELYGRQYSFWFTYTVHNIFNAAACAPHNLSGLLAVRFLAGTFGAAPLTNSGGVIADSFPAAERGLALMIFTIGPLVGPALGPIIGSFVAETVGWRWLMGVMAFFTLGMLIIGIFTLPETYAPVLLRQRALRLSKLNGRVYKSQNEIANGEAKPSEAFKRTLIRPWSLLFREPIVLMLSVYQSIILGTLYLLFAAFPIVYQQARGWSQGIGGLAFLGVLIGNLSGWAYALWESKRFARISKADPSGFAPPEARLPIAFIGAFAIPLGLFWFAWTNGVDKHFVISIAAGIPLGAGSTLVLIGIQNYLVDAYTIYAASVLAGGVFLRSIFAALFPTFTPYMYDGLGIHWASSVPGFLALACMPMPFLFYKYGPAIRQRCKYAKEADIILKRIRGQKPLEDSSSGDQASGEQDWNSVSGLFPVRPTVKRFYSTGLHVEDSPLEDLRERIMRSGVGEHQPEPTDAQMKRWSSRFDSTTTFSK